MGQLGDLEPLVKLGKLFQLVLLQSWRESTIKHTQHTKRKPCWKLIQLCLHLHDLLKQGEHCCWDHLPVKR